MLATGGFAQKRAMSKLISFEKVQLAVLLGFLLLVSLASAQQSKMLLKIQELRAEVETQTNTISIGRNAYDSGFNGSGGLDVQQYPHTATCVVVYDDGKYYLEKRNERSGKPTKAKSATGTLSADELQQLKAILDDGELKKIAMPKAVDMPEGVQELTEAQRLDVQVVRDAEIQQFSFLKERLRLGATITGSSPGGLSGTETVLDNGAPYKKAVSPLMKWFEGLGKKNKLNESKPQYCQ
jgi:hypothetical protein